MSVTDVYFLDMVNLLVLILVRSECLLDLAVLSIETLVDQYLV